MRRRPRAAHAVVFAVAGVLASLVAGACASGIGRDDTGGGDRPRIRVLAAASLTEVLTALDQEFEAVEDVDVDVSFGASSALAQQVVEGVEADVLVTADQRTMAIATDGGATAASPVVVAKNRLAILVETGNPRRVSGIDDLARRELVVVLCAPEVPCGTLARNLLAAAEVTVVPASLEENVKGVVSKVTLGEADAGIVYETDARTVEADADTVSIDMAADARFEAEYPAAVLRSSGAPQTAARFLRFLQSDTAREAFERAGFRSP